MGKIVFANQLRGIAALSVVFLHLAGGFWAWRELIAAHISAPALDGPSYWTLNLVTLFNFGPFGVSIFFLISGFVIPMSLARLTPLQFLVARILRIYPTYIASFAIGMGFVALSATYWHLPFAYDVSTVWKNAFLITPGADLVNWTLLIELRFYVIMAILFALGLGWRLWPLVLVGILAILYNLAFADMPKHFGINFSYLGTQFVYIPYMMIGTCFSYFLHRKISPKALLVSVLVLMALTLLAWQASADRAMVMVVSDVYVGSVPLFALAFTLRSHFRPQALLDFFADISYPLYAVHNLVGMVSLRLAMANHVPPPVAYLVIVPAVIGLAYLIHRLVEVPTTRLGKAVARRLQSADPALSRGAVEEGQGSP
ncbi:acyltransferase family protein [Methylovirgula sp. 4M-Z18]|uniref:acyltransferase family protein n=1 Tax=Methylovirgula sp. 4M-Z18 TaxID=2293567 RepID=UPI001314ADDD|nr:acyltransferase [Methylovirgula sp. 4M-Z18]